MRETKLVPGALVGKRYRLSAPLGKGAHAAVWEALDLSQDCALVALKFSKQTSLERAEVAALLRVVHRSLPRVLDAGTYEDHGYVALERIQGESLERVSSVPSVLRAVVDVADALATLHEAGLVHGDVKPANILVGSERASLVDLGLSSSIGTRAGASGTLAFLAPEALAGEFGASSDLYALGVTAVLALTGRHPFVERDATKQAVLDAIARRSPVRTDVRDALPEAIRASILSLLSHDASARSSARQWLARFARDAAPWLTNAQRELALSAQADPSGGALVGHEAALEGVRAALAAALAGNGLGVVLTGTLGSGRRRVLDDALRAISIEGHARGQWPSVTQSVPSEPERPTIVRMLDATTEAIEAALTQLTRMQRFSMQNAPVVLAATCLEAPSLPGLAAFDVAPLTQNEMRTLLSQVTGRAPTERAMKAWHAHTSGAAGRCVTRARRMDPSIASTAGEADLRAASGAAMDLFAELSPNARALVRAVVIADGTLRDDELGAAAQLEDPFAALREAQLRGALARSNNHWKFTGFIALSALSEPAWRAAGKALSEYDRALEVDHWRRARAAVASGDRAAALDHCVRAAEASSSREVRIECLRVAHSLDRKNASLAAKLASALVAVGSAREALSMLEEVGAPTAEVLLAKGDAMRAARDEAAAEKFSLSLLAKGDEAARSVGAVLRARALIDRGAHAEALALIDAHALKQEGAVALRSFELRALCALLRGDATAALSVLDEAAAQIGMDTAMMHRLSSLRGMALQSRGSHREAALAYESAARDAERTRDAHAHATYAANLGAALLLCGEPERSRVWLERGARELARIGRLWELGRALANLASLHSLLGDRSNALMQAERAEQAATEANDGVALGIAGVLQAECTLRGVRRAEALLSVAARAEQSGAGAIAADARARAAMAFAAENAVDRAQEALASVSDEVPVLKALAALATELARGESDTLRAALDRARELVASEPTPEHELMLHPLAVRSVEALDGDGASLRAARAAHMAKVDAIAALLPEASAAVFRDAHALVARAPAASEAPRRELSSHGELHWRRLAEVTRELNTETELRPLLERIMDAIIELTGASRGFLLLAKPDGALRVRAARNIGRRDIDDSDGSPSRSIAEQVARSGEALVTLDASEDRRLEAYESVAAMRLRSVLAVPLIVHGVSCGTVYVDDRFRAAAFSTEALMIAREFAEAAAVAIHNARTAARLRRTLRKTERLSRQLQAKVSSQTVELDAARRALTTGEEVRGHYEAIIGRGAAIRRTLQLSDRVAATAVSVLLHGETGTGKELIAQAIHSNSPRAKKAFVAVNCGALTETLLESELFGHVRGAFTGADRARQGLFEVADGGTLFLDEVGEMTTAMQAKLLRVLQDGEVRPVGSDRPRKVDVRVIAATHRDLQQMVSRGTFREDLYYRLAVMTIAVPPLRERREDIAALVGFMLEKHGRKDVLVEKKALTRLMDYPWPGNVRQLENEVVRAALLCDGTMRETDLDPRLRAREIDENAAERAPLDLRAALEALERRMVERALREHRGNQTRAAKALGLSRFGLQKMLKRLSMEEVSRELREA